VPENIEIKARVQDLKQLEQLVRHLSGTEPEVLEQVDTFFKVTNGRLKLRKFNGKHGELIQYEREDADEPKSSTYQILTTKQPDHMTTVLSAALGVRGVIRKIRKIFMSGQTRIHLDVVEGLGDFMELEVVLTEGQKHEEGIRIAEELMEKLKIDQADLVREAYVDLLNSGCGNSNEEIQKPQK